MAILGISYNSALWAGDMDLVRGVTELANFEGVGPAAKVFYLTTKMFAKALS